MSWHDSLTWASASDQLKKKAAFRGALFFVRDSDTGVGRRNVVHTYPFRDEPYVEDLGLDVDEFNITGYVIQNIDNGQDYFKERDALIIALKKSGPGILVHPFLGERVVSLIGKARIVETFADGGIARFTMSFVLAEKITAPYPDKIVDHSQAVDDAAEDSEELVRDGLAKKYEASATFGDAVMNDISVFNDMMRLAIEAVRNLGPGAISKAITELTEEYLDIDLTLINQSCELGNSLIGMFNGLLSLVGMYGDMVVDYLFGACSSAVRGISQGPMSGAKVETPSVGFKASTVSTPAKIDEGIGKSAIKASLAISQYGEAPGSASANAYGGTLVPIAITTAARARQSANRVAMVNMIRFSAITTAAKMAIRIDYSSYDSTIEILNEIVDVLDDQLIKLGNDAAVTDYSEYSISIADPDGYQALASLRAVFVKSMIGTGASLARIVEYDVPPVVFPSLVLAYDKYEDITREQEVIDRNVPFVKHPGFLPNGQALEILNE